MTNQLGDVIENFKEISDSKMRPLICRLRLKKKRMQSELKQIDTILSMYETQKKERLQKRIEHMDEVYRGLSN